MEFGLQSFRYNGPFERVLSFGYLPDGAFFNIEKHHPQKRQTDNESADKFREAVIAATGNCTAEISMYELLGTEDRDTVANVANHAVLINRQANLFEEFLKRFANHAYSDILYQR